MNKKRLTEKDLLEGLDAHTAHADELAQPLPQELTPLERLKGSVKRYERPWIRFGASGLSRRSAEVRAYLAHLTDGGYA
ncbi:hypothetical protein DET50_107133 [Marinobacter pelagius]|uniref:Uncharacterized protein n=1 Tax=Marinobacter pelagius TaxID=379482 RepID=A0A366GUA9_9GAMM|nr:hypothetical protein [Marinobacter pelagius]RBP30718.1 hypothetical protein DET50_107133 [Marinobacter pelagius]